MLPGTRGYTWYNVYHIF